MTDRQIIAMTWDECNVITVARL